jgi:hypothetical protein
MYASITELPTAGYFPNHVLLKKAFQNFIVIVNNNTIYPHELVKKYDFIR